jgi:predicted transcriptional regulator
VAPEERRSRRVRDFGTGMAEVAKASPHEQVIAVLDRFPQSEEGQMLVLDGGKLVGTLSPNDVTRALRLRRVSS